MTSLGFLVLARRPNPNGHGTEQIPLSAVFPDLEQAQNALEYCRQKAVREGVALDEVEYVIGEIHGI